VTQLLHFFFCFTSAKIFFVFFSVEPDFLRSSFVTNDTNMIQGTSSASHLEGPHMGMQGGIDLMVLLIFWFVTTINALAQW
jgi:hypothetical protein